MPAIVIAIDEKPKGDPRRLRRVRNIQVRPDVALIVDDYEEDWSRLAWVQVRGRARLVEPGEQGHGEWLAALRRKYPQYLSMRLEALPVIIIERLATTAWRGGGSADAPLARPGREELAALVRGRRSVRAFETRPVSIASNSR